MGNVAANSLADLMQRGGVALQTGQMEEAADVFRRAAESFSDAAAYSNLALVLASIGRFQDAVEASQRAVLLRPDVPEMHGNLGNALQLAGKIGQSIEAYRRAIKLRPDYFDAQINLSHALITRGLFDEAIVLLSEALVARRDTPAALINLALALHGKDDLDGAIFTLTRAIQLHPGLPEAHANIALILKDAGRLDEALEHTRRALSLRPDSRVADSLLTLIQYHPGFDRTAIAREQRAWFQQYIQGRIHPDADHPNDRSPDRRLRVGYVSPDFRAHPVGYNVLPLIEQHDHDQFEIFCYCNVTRPDTLTDRFRLSADHWRDIRPLSDDQAAQMIRGDGIDILVDLALHTGENRLALFARKPAPIQVTFAGYPGSTGLPSIDYRLTDPYLEPPGTEPEPAYEKPLQVPRSFWCYQPSGTEPEVGALPAIANSYVTFGCLNNFCKTNDAVLRLWARVIRALPGSRVIFLAKPGAHRKRTSAFLQDLGIALSRVEFVGQRDRISYLQTYHRVDIGLDTFPYNGHTTSLDSYWMGVPVVTLVGDTPVGRAGWSQLSNLGLDHLAASDSDSFVQIATGLARDLPRLSQLRSTLRDRMCASPLTDSHGFARGVETAFRTIWCNRTGKSTS